MSVAASTPGSSAAGGSHGRRQLPQRAVSEYSLVGSADLHGCRVDVYIESRSFA